MEGEEGGVGRDEEAEGVKGSEKGGNEGGQKGNHEEERVRQKSSKTGREERGVGDKEK